MYTVFRLLKGRKKSLYRSTGHTGRTALFVRCQIIFDRLEDKRDCSGVGVGGGEGRGGKVGGSGDGLLGYLVMIHIAPAVYGACVLRQRDDILRTRCSLRPSLLL